MAALTCQSAVSSTALSRCLSHPFGRPVALTAFLCVIFFFLHLGDRDLASSHEARAAQNAQRILDTGEWALPRLYDGHVEMQKPPLFYWIVALLGALNGGTVDAWCVRLPAALAACGCVFLLLLWGQLRAVAPAPAAAGRPAVGRVPAGRSAGPASRSSVPAGRSDALSASQSAV